MWNDKKNMYESLENKKEDLLEERAEEAALSAIFCNQDNEDWPDKPLDFLKSFDGFDCVFEKGGKELLPCEEYRGECAYSLLTRIDNEKKWLIYFYKHTNEKLKELEKQCLKN